MQESRTSWANYWKYIRRNKHHTSEKKTVKKKNPISKDLNQRQLKALEFLKENETISNKTYQELCKVSKATATRDLTDLVEKFKMVERIGDVGAGTLYKLIGS